MIFICELYLKDMEGREKKIIRGNEGREERKDSKYHQTVEVNSRGFI